MRTKVLHLTYAIALLGAGSALAQMTWHPPLEEFAKRSELILVGRIVAVKPTLTRDELPSHWEARESEVRVLSVIKGPPGLKAVRLFDIDMPLTSDGETGVKLGATYLFFLVRMEPSREVFVQLDGNHGGKRLPEEQPARDKALELVSRHLDLVTKSQADWEGLRKVILSELETPALFDLGFSALFRAKEAKSRLLQTLAESDRIRIFKVFKDQPLSYMNWANLSDILLHAGKCSEALTKSIARKIEAERMACQYYSYFYAMCLVDASVEADLGTGVPAAGSAFAHVIRWEKMDDNQRQRIIDVFFERLDLALPGWRSKQEHPGAK